MNASSLLFAARRLRLFPILFFAMGALLAASPGLRAQAEIPGGTALAVRLNTSLSSKKSKAGETIPAREEEGEGWRDIPALRRESGEKLSLNLLPRAANHIR